MASNVASGTHAGSFEAQLRAASTRRAGLAGRVTPPRRRRLYRPTHDVNKREKRKHHRDEQQLYQHLGVQTYTLENGDEHVELGLGECPGDLLARMYEDGVDLRVGRGLLDDACVLEVVES